MIGSDTSTPSTQSHTHFAELALGQWGSKIDELVARADRVGNKVQAVAQDQLDALKIKHLQVKAKVDGLRAATDDNIADLRHALDVALEDLDTAYQRLRANL